MIDRILLRILKKDRYITYRLWFQEHTGMALVLATCLAIIFAFALIAGRISPSSHDGFVTGDVIRIMTTGYDDSGTYHFVAALKLAEGNEVLATTSSFPIAVSVVDTACVEQRKRENGTKLYYIVSPNNCEAVN